MFRRLNHRGGHYALLVAVSAVLFLPKLGAPSLWDIDEGNNAEAAREMRESGNWLVPTFNFQLRVDKPALLYWLQIAGYRIFGVGEFAARLPSALAGLISVLLTYELGRRLFNAGTGLLAGLVLASAAMFCASARFANPDAVLNALTLLSLLVFWQSFSKGGRGWFVPAGASAGLAVLAKGPAGVVLPFAVTLLFLFWSRRLRVLCDRRLLLGILAFILIALPWYAWVAAETRGDFVRGFFWIHNVARFRASMEGHSGPIYYYLVALAVGFAPWSPFLALGGWYAVKDLRGTNLPGEASPGRFVVGPSMAGPAATNRRTTSGLDPRPGIRFLCCWIAVYLVFFSLASTKLPNYILPLYPPAAVWTARFLDRWRPGVILVPQWAVALSLAAFAVVGLGAAFGLLLAGDVIDLPLLRDHRLPGLEVWAAVGVVPILGAALAWWYARQRRPMLLLTSLAATALAFVGLLAVFGSVAVDAYKAPRPLVRALEEQQTEREVRVGCYQYFQPSLVFYCRRTVCRLEDEEAARAFLRYPVPVYLFVPAPIWAGLEASMPGPHRLLARHFDLYRGCDILLVTNR